MNEPSCSVQGPCRRTKLLLLGGPSNQLCQELTVDGGKAIWTLCDGFGIPDELLFAPIAFDWKLIGTEQSAI